MLFSSFFTFLLCLESFFSAYYNEHRKGGIKMKEIQPNELSSVFDAIGKQWMLITAKKDGKVNTMTASWGGMGILWNKKVAMIFVRPQRYTKQFIDGSDTFSLTFFDESYREQLRYLGTVSGKDEDKINACHFTVIEDTAPYFKEATCSVFCKKLYKQDLEAQCFIDQKLMKDVYPQEDYHTMYIGEITKILVHD